MEHLGTRELWTPPDDERESANCSMAAPSSISKWSEPESSEASATQKLLQSLDDKDKLIEAERKKADVARRKCEALLAEMTARAKGSADGSQRRKSRSPESGTDESASAAVEDTSEGTNTANDGRKSPSVEEESSGSPSDGGEKESLPAAAKKKRAKSAAP